MDNIALIKQVVQCLAKRYDFDEHDGLNCVILCLKCDIVKPATSNDGLLNTCHAYIKTKDGVSRCSRDKSCGNFCKTHNKMNEKGTLKYGSLKETAKVVKETLKITVKNEEYLYDAVSRKVYTLPRNKSLPKFVGYLSTCGCDIKDIP
jgi:hypothetical protein